MDPHTHAADSGNPHVHRIHSSSEKEQQEGSLSLSQEINASARQGHVVVNRLIMSRLALGLQDYTLYREGILSFSFVFKTFEEEWASLISSTSSTIDPRIKGVLQKLYSEPLLRTPQLTKDLRYYFGSTPFSMDVPNTIQRTATVNYIRQVIAEKPHILIAYAYNYYMALFAGGKILKYQISKAEGFFPQRYGIVKEERCIAGTNLFSFEVDQGKEDGLRTSFKVALSEIESALSSEERSDIVEESKRIFSNNELIIRELDKICASLATVPPSTSVMMVSKVNDRYKFFTFFIFLTFFVIYRRIASG